MPSEPELILHVWPGRWELPTFTPACLAATLYLQLTIPGKFVVEECTNPDVSPDGQLPYLTHGLACIASFPSIVKYVEGLERNQTQTEEEDEDPDREDGLANLAPPGTRVKRAQETAWLAFVSAHLGDLLACSFFTLRHNYYDFVRTALAELFPVPQRYYVPDRLRHTHKSRLEAAGLWSISMEEAEEEKRRQKGLAGSSVVQEAFGKAKVLDKARTTLDILSRLLGDSPFFLDSPEPSALDASVSAHILLLTIPPFPNDLLRVLIDESYPSLFAHTRRIQARTLSPAESHALAASLSHSFEVVEPHPSLAEAFAPLKIRSEPRTSFSQAISSLAIPFSFQNTFSIHKGRKSKADKEFDRIRWGWYGIAALSVVGWIWYVRHRIQFVLVDEMDDSQEFQGTPVQETEEDIGEEEEEDDEEEK